MVFTFNPSLSTPLSRIRQEIGDTDIKAPQFEDAIITAKLAATTSELQCAYELALNLGAKYARITEITVDHQTSRGDVISKAYYELADRLLARIRRESPASTVALPGVWALGIGDTTGPYGYPPLPPLCQ